MLNEIKNPKKGDSFKCEGPRCRNSEIYGPNDIYFSSGKWYCNECMSYPDIEISLTPKLLKAIRENFSDEEKINLEKIYNVVIKKIREQNMLCKKQEEYHDEKRLLVETDRMISGLIKNLHELKTPNVANTENVLGYETLDIKNRVRSFQTPQHEEEENRLSEEIEKISREASSQIRKYSNYLNKILISKGLPPYERGDY